MNNSKKDHSIKIRFFNVVIQPAKEHKKENYIQLMRIIAQKAIEYNTLNNRYTKMKSLSCDGGFMFGKLINYTTINSRSDYKGNDIDVFSIDRNLQNNIKEWSFCFYPPKHLLAIYSEDGKQGVPYTQVRKFFTLAFKDASEILELEDVVVSSITSDEGIEEIFALDYIKSLTIEVSYSNNTNNKSFKKYICDNELKRQNVGKMKVKITSPDMGKIKLQDTSFISSLLWLSQRHGSAQAEGWKDGEPQKVNTEKYPLEIIKKVSEGDLLSVIKNTIKSIIKNIIK